MWAHSQSETTNHYDKLADVDDGAVEGVAHVDAENYLVMRRLERKVFYLKISVSILAVLFLLSLISRNGIPHILGNTRWTTASPTPHLTSITTTFAQSDIYSRRPNTDSDAAWNALLPPGRGFVYVPDASHYDLPPGEATPYGDIYSVTVFHQLHCLGQLRRFTWWFLDTIIASNETASESATHGEEMRQAILKMFVDGDAEQHLTHCFDYLRQGLMCNADMSLEWPRTELDGRRFAVDGWNIPHMCRSWDEVSNFMEERHFNMSTNTEIAPIGGTAG